jgi:hypothetical protein
VGIPERRDRGVRDACPIGTRDAGADRWRARCGAVHERTAPLRGATPGLCDECVDGEAPADDVVNGLAEPVVTTDVTAQQFEGVIDADVVVFGDEAFGLFDHDA